MDIWRSVGNNSGEVVSRLRCSPVDERLSDSVNRKSYRTNSDIILFTVMFGLVPDIHRHKAQPHDMHVESNALQQRFAPQPVMRSSWLRLVIFGQAKRVPEISLTNDNKNSYPKP